VSRLCGGVGSERGLGGENQEECEEFARHG
jgi:hypothetical protein